MIEENVAGENLQEPNKEDPPFLAVISGGFLTF